MTAPMRFVMVLLTVAEWEHGRQRGIKRSESMGHRDTKNSQNWTGGPGWKRHVAGGRAEVAYTKWSGQPLTRNVIGRGDGGIDFADGTQLKSSEHAMPNVLVPKKQWNRPDVPKSSYFVLAKVITRERKVQIIGAITYKDASRKKVSRIIQTRRGLVPSWFIDAGHLGDLRMIPHILARFPVQSDLLQ